MQLSRQVLLLFTLNFVDAVMTIYWIHYGFATEGNTLMAEVLNLGYVPFLLVKIAVGATSAIVLWRWRNFRLAKVGLAFALIAYIGLMGVHFVTGLSAFGFISDTLINDVSGWSNSAFGFFS